MFYSGDEPEAPPWRGGSPGNTANSSLGIGGGNTSTPANATTHAEVGPSGQSESEYGRRRVSAEGAQDSHKDHRDDGVGQADRYMETAFVPLASPTVDVAGRFAESETGISGFRGSLADKVVAARSAQGTEADAKRTAEGGAGATRRRQLVADEEHARQRRLALLHGRGLQYMLAPVWNEEQLELLRLPAKSLTEQQMIALLPDWQRRLVPQSVHAVDGALGLIQEQIIALYGESQCNATSRENGIGCDHTYGQCLNVSGLPVDYYDQNGTCKCHHWYIGGDCSTLDVSGDRCTLGEGLSNYSLPDDECRVLRSKLYMCGKVQSGDGMPRACVDGGLTALECLEGGYLSGQPSSPPTGGGGGPSDGGGNNGGDGGDDSVTGVNRPYRSTWLLEAAKAARTHSCSSGAITEENLAIGGTTVTGESLIPLFDCNDYGGYLKPVVFNPTASFGAGATSDPATDSQGASGIPVGFDKSAQLQGEEDGVDNLPYEANLRGHPEGIRSAVALVPCSVRNA